MPPPLTRGAVVIRDGRYDVVWDVVRDAAPNASEVRLVVMPVLPGPLRPRDRRGFDVPVELADLIAAGIALPEAVVRPERSDPVGAARYDLVGELPGRLMCRVVHQLARAAADAMMQAKWAAERAQRGHADERCVNLTR